MHAAAALPDPMGKRRQWAMIALIKSDCERMECGEDGGAWSREVKVVLFLSWRAVERNKENS